MTTTCVSQAGLSRRRRVVRSPAELPVRLYRHMFREMARELSGTAPAHRCSGLSFAFRLLDRADVAVCYRVQPNGLIRVAPGLTSEATFTFAGASSDFDAVLIGTQHPLPLLLSRRIGFHGSLFHLRRLLVMLPALQSSYRQCRSALRLTYASEFDFRF